jgi:hypothetical protein
VSGSGGRLARAALGLAPDEPDQVPRLQRYRAAHPGVIIAAGEFGTWQARISGRTARRSPSATRCGRC